jgi:heme oxygenase (biliverdin-IX-beta and delta-forming)
MVVSDTQAHTVRGRLRNATAQSHRSLETAMAIAETCREPEGYRRMIARLWGIYTPLEAALMRIDWPGAETLVRQRAKAGWLASDLAFLGFAPGDIGKLPRARDLPIVDTVADVFGVAYVLEGATLGGQVILPRLKSDLGLSESAGGRFFASYGQEVGRQWRAFVDALERFGRHSRSADRIEFAALQAFESFRRWMSEAAPRTEGRDHVR